MTDRTYDVQLCSNCVVWHFNRDDTGVLPDDPRPWALWADTPGHYVLADVHADPIEHFSWYDCDGCGGMAGTRWDYVLTIVGGASHA